MRHVIYMAIGFPPAAKSSAHRMKATANLLAEHGCRVTVVTIAQDSWRREHGLDPTLSTGIHPRVTVVEVPLSRKDVDPNLRSYSWLRARHRSTWLKLSRLREQLIFPEPVFGSWRRALEQIVLEIHARHPADLVLVSTVPYTGLAAAWKLWRNHRVPYAIDFRDAWSLDVIGGDVAFPIRSRRGRWEQKLVEHALATWCVNAQIRDHYVQRYPGAADRIKVVGNGSDLRPMSFDRRPNPDGGLTFGYIGTGVLPVPDLKAVLDGWRLARQLDPVLSRSRLVFRGYFGWQSADMADARRALLHGAASEAVAFGGPVHKADLRATYAEWDALLFLIIGGRFMTSGKVYEYLATGLPIMSAHTVDHGAVEVLRGYPLWIPPPVEMMPARLADTFVATAQRALGASEETRAAAVAYAARYERRAQMGPAVSDLVSQLGDPTSAHRSEPSDVATASVLK